MSRPRPSLFGPIAFAFCSLVFAAGAGYTWWLDHRANAAAPLPEVRTATLPMSAAAPPALVRPARDASRLAQHAQRYEPAAATVVRKCLGADGVPVFTSAACPNGSTLQREIAVEVPARSPSPPAAAAQPAVAVATSNATVVNMAPEYGIPDRRYRRDVEREIAWDRCERAKVRARAEVAALRNKRTMSDIRRWDDHVVHECAPYKVMTR